MRAPVLVVAVELMARRAAVPLTSVTATAATASRGRRRSRRLRRRGLFRRRCRYLLHGVTSGSPPPPPPWPPRKEHRHHHRRSRPRCRRSYTAAMMTFCRTRLFSILLFTKTEHTRPLHAENVVRKPADSRRDASGVT